MKRITLFALILLSAFGLNAQNDYDLSINKYKKTEYKPVEYAPTKDILAEINELEAQIQQGLKELEGML